MRTGQAPGGRARRLVAISLALLVSLPAAATPPRPSVPPGLGPLLDPDVGRVVVRHQSCRCHSDAGDSPEILLLTVGTESPGDGALHFHPLASLAFDPSLGEDDSGQWMALWTFGPSAPGWRRTLKSLLPVPLGAPRASVEELKRLEARLAEMSRNPASVSLEAPDPAIHLADLGRSSPSHGVWGALRRGLGWANVLEPVQLMFRTYLERRTDRRERRFQRTYLAVQWLLDVEYTGEDQPSWLAAANELRFHLLRNRSFFGRWVLHADSLELVYNYESDVRRQLGKTSSWLQSAANEHYLRYQPISRYTDNGPAVPMGGVLYYDPRLGATPDPGWWRVANPFDLPYNPFTHPEVQRLAREHPDELIPLAVYTFQTQLSLRPIIAIDFFAPGNPRSREATQQLMVLAKQWLAISTSSLSLERLPYRVVSWAANKKGFTRLVDKSSRLGIEELRLALEAGLYFDPELRPVLLERADQRVLNPLVKPGPVEERLAHLQYESLLARDAQAVCRTLQKVRRKMSDRLGVPAHLAPAEQRQELARRLQAWQHQVHLQDFAAQPLEDFSSLAALEAPLRFFLTAETSPNPKLEELLAELYAKLYAQQLRLRAEREAPELHRALTLTQQAWERYTVGAAAGSFASARAKLEEELRLRDQARRRAEEEKRVRALRQFLEDSHEQLEHAQRAGCQAATDAPAELEAHLTLLVEMAQAADTDAHLRTEFDRYVPRLRHNLGLLEASLGHCPVSPTDTWQADWHQSFLELTHALRQELDQRPPLQAAGGVD